MIKKMKKTQKFLILGFILAFSSCTEPDLPIPKGNHTFSCKINGELFLPQGTGGGWSSLPTGDGLYFNKYNNDLSYSVSASNSKYRVYFGIYNRIVGTFTLVDSDGVFHPGDRGDINHAIVLKNGVKYVSKQGSGTVTFIELSDDGNKRGTFEFTVYNENNSSDVLYVTSGQFDN